MKKVLSGNTSYTPSNICPVLLLPRETQEESGLAVTNLDEAGVIIFEFIGQPQLMECHVFRTTCYSGQPAETDGEYCMHACIYTHSHCITVFCSRNASAVV